MIIQRDVSSITIICFSISASCAQESSRPANPKEPAPVSSGQPETSGASTHSSAGDQKSIELQTVDKKGKVKAGASASKIIEKEITKFKSKVSRLIALRAHNLQSVGDGYASTSFRVNEMGNIDSISIKSSSSPKHAEAAKKILSGVHAGSSPDVPILLNQNFRFH